MFLLFLILSYRTMTPALRSALVSMQRGPPVVVCKVDGSVIVFTERDAEDHRQEEAHLQAGPGRVHRPREDRERLREEQRCGSGLCPRRQSAGG